MTTVSYHPWYLSEDDSILWLNDDTDYTYHVELEWCLTSAEMLDNIMQVANKSWATDKHVAQLVRALNDILDPQATLCSFGQNKELSEDEAEKRIKEFRNVPAH